MDNRDRALRAARRAARLALLAGAFACLTAQAPFPVPIPASVVVLPLLLLFGGVAAVKLSHDDEKAIAALEARSDWTGLVHLAERRLSDAATRGERGAAAAGTAGDARWRFVRAHALQRLGRCAEAIVDYELARPAAGAAGADADLQRALCEMSLERWTAAQRTLESMTQSAAQRWDAWYNLGVVRARLGDLDGARAAQRELEVLQPDKASALGADHVEPLAARIAASPADARRVPALAAVPTVSALDAASVPGMLAAGAMSIGGRVLVLPDGAWVLASVRRFGVPGKAQFRSPPLPFDTPALEGVAFGPAGDAGVPLLAFAANPRAGDGVVAWDVEPCRVRDAIHVERFAGRFDTPECLVVRRVPADDPEVLAQFGAAFETLRAQQAPRAALYYEVRYARYWVAWFARVTALLPATSVPGDFVALQWGRLLADAVRPLAESKHRSAVVPPPP